MKGNWEKMKRRLRAILSLLLGVAALSSAFPAVAQEGTKPNGGLHSIGELNDTNTLTDDHAGETEQSTIETNFRNSYTMTAKDMGLLTGYLWYPRIKKLAEDDYILFFQNGRWGPNVYYAKSTDGRNWGEPVVLFKQKLVQDGKYKRAYATCDAILLENGDLVAAAIFRPLEGTQAPSRFNMEERGIAVKISHDKGLTWTEENIVYHSRVWEPSFLQLPNGDLQMYLTHSGPKDAIFKTQMGSEVSSGIAMLVSKDNGVTWEPDALSYPYEATRIAQQKIYDYNGIAIMTDQMPVAILLHDGETIAMAAESKWPAGGHRLTLIRSHDFFATELAMDEYGPSDRTNNIVTAAGPYLAQFPSGEILVSLFASKQMKVFLGNETATELYTNRTFLPLGKDVAGLWGSIEITGTHTALISAGDVIVEPNVVNNLRTNGLAIAEVVLNHRVDAKRAAVTLDGRTNDWWDNTDALFVGSDSQAQASLRFAHDTESIYLLSERLDYDLQKTDKITVTLARTGGKEQIKLVLSAEGIESAQYTDSDGKRSALDADTIPCATRVYGTLNNSSDTDEGIVHELSLPRELLNITAEEELAVFVKLQNVDEGASAKFDTFDGTNESDKTTWLRVRLVDTAAADPLPLVTDSSEVSTDLSQTTSMLQTSDPSESATVSTDLPAPSDSSSNRSLLAVCAAACAAAAIAVIAAVLTVRKKK